MRVNGKLGTFSADTRSRLFAVVETQHGASAPGLARARRLALLALRTARAVDGDLVQVAAKDPDDEVRRLAMTAAAAPTAEGAAIPEADREAALRAGLKDTEPRVRLEALRGWGRHAQARDCQPLVDAVADASTHVALQAIDLLGAGCPAGVPVSALLQKEADGLPALRRPLAPVGACHGEPGARGAGRCPAAAAALRRPSRPGRCGCMPRERRRR